MSPICRSPRIFSGAGGDSVRGPRWRQRRGRGPVLTCRRWRTRCLVSASRPNRRDGRHLSLHKYADPRAQRTIVTLCLPPSSPHQVKSFSQAATLFSIPPIPASSRPPLRASTRSCRRAPETPSASARRSSQTQHGHIPGKQTTPPDPLGLRSNRHRGRRPRSPGRHLPKASMS